MLTDSRPDFAYFSIRRKPSDHAATVALQTSDHGPFSPRVFTHRSMETAVLPQSAEENSDSTESPLHARASCSVRAAA